MKKALKVLGFSLLVLLLVVIVAVNFFAGNVVKTAVNAGGPVALGVPVTLDDAEVRLLRGFIKLDGFVIGNPEGYKSDHMFKMNEFRIDMHPRSVLTDTIRIREIVIDAPDITYEMSMKGSNFGALIDSLSPKESEGDAEETDGEEEKEDKAAKRVEIDRFVLSNAKIRLTSKLLQGKGVTIPLPTVELTDIGKDDSASIASAMKEIMVAVAGSVVTAVKSSGKLLGDGAKLIGDGAMVVGDSAAEAGTAVLDGGKAAAGAVTEGAGKVIGGIGGLFKKGNKESSEPAPEE